MRRQLRRKIQSVFCEGGKMKKEVFENCELYCGDCLEIMPTLPPASLDLVLTDPPYMIQNVSAGNPNKIDPWADIINASFLYSAVFKAFSRLLTQDGGAFVFTNWHGFPSFYKAGFDADLPVRGCIVWDKQFLGPGHYLRHSYELILLLPKEKFYIPNRSLKDILSFNSAKRETEHPAEKPTQLMSCIISEVPQAKTIIDPFMGSGTTGVACVRNGRKFIGIELNEKYFDMACRRIEAETKQMKFDFEEVTK